MCVCAYVRASVLTYACELALLQIRVGVREFCLHLCIHLTYACKLSFMCVSACVHSFVRAYTPVCMYQSVSHNEV